MKADKYIPNATTVEDCFSNAEFQIQNIKGWMSVGQLDNAAIKAQCLIEASVALLESFRKAGVHHITAEEVFNELAKATK